MTVDEIRIYPAVYVSSWWQFCCKSCLIAWYSKLLRCEVGCYRAFCWFLSFWTGLLVSYNLLPLFSGLCKCINYFCVHIIVCYSKMQVWLLTEYAFFQITFKFALHCFRDANGSLSSFRARTDLTGFILSEKIIHKTQQGICRN